MIIKTFQTSNISSSKSNFFLLYGDNDGFKKKIINEYLLKGYEGNVFKYEESEILKNGEDFFLNIKNKSFFYNKKVILISRGTDKIFKVIDDLTNDDIQDVRVIISSSLLDKKSKLRNKFEKEKNLVCIPFYTDDNLTLNKIAYDFFKKKNLSISQESLNILIERCKGDRENLQNELLKIDSFTKFNDKITLEDIFKLTNLAENYTYSELSDHCLNKNVKKVINIINENNYTSDDCVAITRVLLSKIKRLVKLKQENEIEKNIDNVITRHKPPIFWKEKDFVKSQMKIWSLDKAKDLIYKVNELELNIKKENLNSVNILYDFILTHAQPNN